MNPICGMSRDARPESWGVVLFELSSLATNCVLSRLVRRSKFLVEKALLLATTNPGKLEELRALLDDLRGVALVAPVDLGLTLEVEETGASYVENAALKARAYMRASGLATLADDSGLEVEALEGAPGLYSARYAPQPKATDADRRAYLLEQLAGNARPWKAVFRSVVCVVFLDGQAWFAEGECRGEIIREERGMGGFGYDPVFLVDGQGRTMAELSMKEKNQLSHRARAVAAAKARLAEWAN